MRTRSLPVQTDYLQGLERRFGIDRTPRPSTRDLPRLSVKPGSPLRTGSGRTPTGRIDLPGRSGSASAHAGSIQFGPAPTGGSPVTSGVTPRALATPLATAPLGSVDLYRSTYVGTSKGIVPPSASGLSGIGVQTGVQTGVAATVVSGGVSYNLGFGLGGVYVSGFGFSYDPYWCGSLFYSPFRSVYCSSSYYGYGYCYSYGHPYSYYPYYRCRPYGYRYRSYRYCNLFCVPTYSFYYGWCGYDPYPSTRYVYYTRAEDAPKSEIPDHLSPAERQFCAGWLALREGEYSAAADAFRTASDRLAQPGLASYFLGLAQAGAGEYDRAAEAFAAGLGAHPALVRYEWNVAAHFGSSDRYNALVKRALDAAENATAPASVWVTLAALHQIGGESELARRAAGGALFAGSDSVVAESILAELTRRDEGAAVDPLAPTDSRVSNWLFDPSCDRISRMKLTESLTF